MNLRELQQLADKHFIDLRRVSTGDYHTHKYLDSGYYVRLSSAYAICMDQWKPFAHHDRELIRIYADGLGLETSIVVLNAAARLHGLWVIGDNPMEVATRAGNQPARSRWRGRRYVPMVLRPGQFKLYCGVRITTPAQTCIDIARRYGFIAGLVAMDSYLAQGFSRNTLTKALASLSKLKGLKTARKCLKYAIDDSGSPWESRVRAYLIEAGFAGRVETQKRILNYRTDLCIDGWLVIEIDGNVKYDGTYGSPEAAIIDERRREKAITNAGHRVLRFAPSELRSPEHFLEIIRKELELGPRLSA